MLNEGLKNADLKRSSEKNFGIVFSIAFAVFGVLAFLNDNNYFFFCTFSLLFLILAFKSPHSLKVYNVLWFRFGILLGAIVAPVIMFLVYCITIIPLSLWLKIRGADILKLKSKPHDESYWVQRTKKLGSMKNLY
jgi:hypothetical protein